jgi:hypothetical protein
MRSFGSLLRGFDGHGRGTNKAGSGRSHDALGFRGDSCSEHEGSNAQERFHGPVPESLASILVALEGTRYRHSELRAKSVDKSITGRNNQLISAVGLGLPMQLPNQTP